MLPLEELHRALVLFRRLARGKGSQVAPLPGAGIDHAARLIGRVSGDSTVAYQLAFARAIEAAAGCEPPPRAVWLRALLSSRG